MASNAVVHCLYPVKGLVWMAPTLWHCWTCFSSWRQAPAKGHIAKQSLFRPRPSLLNNCRDFGRVSRHFAEFTFEKNWRTPFRRHLCRRECRVVVDREANPTRVSGSCRGGVCLSALASTGLASAAFRAMRRFSDFAFDPHRRSQHVQQSQSSETQRTSSPQQQHWPLNDIQISQVVRMQGREIQVSSNQRVTVWKRNTRL